MKLRLLFRNLTRRKKLILWICFGFVVPWLYPAWILWRGPLPIRISRETTFLTEPVHASGYVDYSFQANRCLLDGVPEGATLDPAAVVSAFQSLQGALPRFNRGATDVGITLSVEQERQLEDFIELLKDNNGVLTFDPIPDQLPYFNSFFGPDMDLMSNVIIGMEQLLPAALKAQWLHHVKQGNTDEAMLRIDALISVQEFVLRQGAGLGSLFATEIETDLLTDCAELLAEGQLSTESCQQILQRLPVVSHHELHKQLELQRLWKLSCFNAVHSRSMPLDVLTFASPSYVERLASRLLSRWVVAHADWNRVCEDINLSFDQAELELAEIFGGAVITGQPLTGVKPQFTRESNLWLSQQNATDDLIFWSRLNDPGIGFAYEMCRCQRKREVLNAATFMLDYKAANGSWPESLTQAGFNDLSRISKEGPAFSEDLTVMFGDVVDEFQLTIGTGGDSVILEYQQSEAGPALSYR